ncbi:MAG TPA: hypothetical protein VFB58_14300 [Chloroflexota bacterium]|nr:hypothetical protein [Chloroflexota bacterium]
MVVLLLTALLVLVVGGLILYGAVAYRRQAAGREVLWTGMAALLLVLLFAYVR